MIRVQDPAHSFAQSLDDCVAGIATSMTLRGRLVAGRAQLLNVGDEYADAARRGDLVRFVPFLGEKTQVVLAGLTKGDLLKTYDQYFVPEAKIARRIYNALLSAALEKCPFCGGIGTPRNLDHFLPKAHFPQFSVLPHNLVPACRDCNMDGKGEGFANVADGQPLQPYLETAKFFDEQWVFATYRAGAGGAPGTFDYFVQAPGNWPEVDKRRVENHFRTFDLAKRYSVKAAEHLGTVLAQMQTMRGMGLSEESIAIALLDPAISSVSFVNHWQRGMYQALKETG